MSFLDWPVEHHVLPRSTQLRRKSNALKLTGRFAAEFPDIEYKLFWESAIINAQAWLEGDRKHVTVYGGLVRHPTIRSSGLALMLAHETGHHLGGPPFDPDLRWPSW